MPAPLNVDREQVRMLVLAVGVREAARQMGLQETTVLQWSHRGNWLAHARPAPPPKLPASMTPTNVIGVISPADALANSLEDDSRESRVSLSRGLRKAAKAVEDMPGEEVLGAAQDVKALAGALSVVHRWEGSGSAASVSLNLLIQT